MPTQAERGKFMNQEKVQVIAAQSIDFTPRDQKEPIKGTKIYFIRPAYENELGRGWTKNIVLQHLFVRDGSSVQVPVFGKIPCNCIFNYEARGRYNEVVSIEVKE